MRGPGELLERDEALHVLHAALAAARDGRGGVAIVSGEAGAGKTTLIREFLDRAAGAPRVLIGACDPLAAPRPFGPLIDAATAVDPDAARRLAAGISRAEAFALALELVTDEPDGRPTCVFAIEDAHWADEASLDLITFLGRRLRGRRVLLIVSYRDDEVGADHPLRARLGELGTAITARVALAGLSTAAVASLADGTPLDPVELHRATGGNPFFVTEVLASGDDAIPESVREAVLSRASRLDPGARAVLEAVSIVPGRVDAWLLDALLATQQPSDLDQCVRRGLLQPDADGSIVFRHQLARQAITDAVPPARRRSLHHTALAALRSPSAGAPDHPRLTYHAAEAGDGPAVVAHGPPAAAQAAAVGAHREAVRHLETVLRFEQLVDVRTRAELYVALAVELTAVAQPHDAVTMYDNAAALLLEVGDIDAAAETIARSGGPFVNLGRGAEALDRVTRAAAMIEGRPDSSAAAAVAEMQSSLHMLERQFDQAEHYGQLAMSLAERSGNELVLAEACVQSGIALAMSGDDAGLARIRRGIDIGARIGSDRVVALGYLQIGSGYGELRRYDIAVPALHAGIEHASARENMSSLLYTTAWLGRCELELGHWEEAGRIAGELLRQPRGVGISRFVALVTLGWLRARRGDPDAAPMLDEALELARATGHLQRLWPVAACRAEAAWLRQRLDDELDLVEEAAALARSFGYAPAVEELASWQRTAGANVVGAVEHIQTPFGLSATGRDDLAAERWHELGCPYEEAMARFRVGTPDQLKPALATFDRLGAAPMRARAVGALRDAGEAVPRGPSGASRRNPYALTDRELDVLAMIGTGGTDREIGVQLGISTKTVSHHVSRVLTKLQVRTRSEAAVEAERMGLVPPRGTVST